MLCAVLCVCVCCMCVCVCVCCVCVCVCVYVCVCVCVLCVCSVCVCVCVCVCVSVCVSVCVCVCVLGGLLCLFVSLFVTNADVYVQNIDRKIQSRVFLACKSCVTEPIVRDRVSMAKSLEHDKVYASFMDVFWICVPFSSANSLVPKRNAFHPHRTTRKM